MPAVINRPLNHDRIAFKDEGYCVVAPGLPAAEMDAVGARLDRQIANLPAGRRPESLVEPHVFADDWRFWLELCRHPAVLDSVAACLRCDGLLLIMSHLIVKPPGDGLPILWHQDNTYWPTVHGVDIATVWLAVDDVDLGNGCMKVIPRSHAGHPALAKIASDGDDLLKVRVDVAAAAEASAVAIEMPRGAWSLHDSFIIHGSERNRSSRRRAGYTMRYADPARVRVDCAAHHVPVYHVRGAGATPAGAIDLRPGRPLPATSGAEREGVASPMAKHGALTKDGATG